MTYEQALQFWFGRINYERRSVSPGDLRLDRMLSLLALLGNPQERLPVIHIAGSKGKGSTAAILASVLHQAGFRTGLFTSPHLCRAEERIQIDGRSISAQDLTALVAEVAAAVRVMDGQEWNGRPGVSFFEIATALGFLHFSRQNVDAAILEVGLGGRFDATNVCRPILSLITSISFDHVQQLGNTLAKIAGEKAGIIKTGCPVLSGAGATEAQEVIEAVCRQRSAPLRQLGIDFDYHYQPGIITQQVARPPRVAVHTDEHDWPAMQLGLLGDHQAANAALAVVAVEELRRQGWDIAKDSVQRGLANLDWPARLEVTNRRPFVILDCAHNCASAKMLLMTLRQSFPTKPAENHLIFAASRDKDVTGMLDVLAPHFDRIYLTKYRNNPRFVSPEQIVERLQPHRLRAFTICATPEEAWQRARSAAGAQHLICITGSVYLAGELRPLLLQQSSDSTSLRDTV